MYIFMDTNQKIRIITQLNNFFYYNRYIIMTEIMYIKIVASKNDFYKKYL